MVEEADQVVEAGKVAEGELLVELVEAKQRRAAW